MGSEAKLSQDIADFLIVVTFIEAHALRLRLRWLRAFDDEAVERGPHPFHVMPVGAIHRQPKGDAVGLRHQAALDPAFGAIGGVGASFFSPQAVP